MGDITLETPPMPTEEVLEILNGMMFGEQSFKRFNKEEREALSRVIDLVEKRIPKPVKHRYVDVFGTGDILCNFCPSCNQSLGDYEKYCVNCGQAINFGEGD